MDALATQRNASRSEVLRWLLDASENYEALQLIEEVAYRRPAVLPVAHRHKFVPEFSVMMGTDHLSFRRGQIISTDSHTLAMIAQLFARGAKLEALEPLPD